MKSTPSELPVSDIISLKTQQMLIVNPEYQRGAVWTSTQQKRLVDSVLRGYPIPLIYFHHITQEAGGLKSERFEIIDGQQRINALSDYRDGAFKLLDPIIDEAEARFPDFIKKQPCPWGRKTYQDLDQELKKKLDETILRIVKIETDDPNEARDLFVRLQAGMPLNSQEKRDAWPGQFTDFVLRLGGKTGLAKYPGNDFFNELLRGNRAKDRGKIRQLAAQIAMLFLTKRDTGNFCDINAPALDDYYYEKLSFDANSEDAKRLLDVLDKITFLLRDQKRPKLIGHEAIHLVLLVDALMDEYTRSWESNLATAFDQFRANLAQAKKTRYDSPPSDYWLSYGVGTRVNSDRHDMIQRRHEFFAEEMRKLLNLQLKDPQRSFGPLERELIYYRDKKTCMHPRCGVDVAWPDAEIHHVKPHRHGGESTLDNGALVHRQCHPKGEADETEFAEKWAKHVSEYTVTAPSSDELQVAAENSDENGDD